jgi:hypothetical protein
MSSDRGMGKRGIGNKIPQFNWLISLKAYLIPFWIMKLQVSRSKVSGILYFGFWILDFGL